MNERKRTADTSVMELPWRLFAAIVALWFLVGIVPFLVWRDLHSAAEFASTFGVVNALFAALAFGGVIWAIRLQTKELELQRLEIEETRDELRRSADAQDQSQQMHFLAALLAARNNVAQGYAAAAAQETGALKPNQAAHRQHLAELEWLLQIVDRHPGNPFALPDPATLAAHQVAALLWRSCPVLQSALRNRATNHARNVLLDMNSALREFNSLLADDDARRTEIAQTLGKAIVEAETVATAADFEEIEQTSQRVFDGLSATVSKALGIVLPRLALSERC